MFLHLKKLLSSGFHRSGGRNNQGLITLRHRGGGHKKVRRSIDLSRYSSFANVVGLSYDPARSAHLALIRDISTNSFSFIIAPKGISIGSSLFSLPSLPSSSLLPPLLLAPGTSAPISSFPIGSLLHHIQLHPLKHAQLLRSAGSFAQLIRLTSRWALLRLPNKRLLVIPSSNTATLGIVSGSIHKLYKAGQSRWLGFRPRVRGEAMNAVDHPHGGRTRGGRLPRTIWGKLAKGVPTSSSKNKLLSF